MLDVVYLFAREVSQKEVRYGEPFVVYAWLELEAWAPPFVADVWVFGQEAVPVLEPVSEP